MIGSLYARVHNKSIELKQAFSSLSEEYTRSLPCSFPHSFNHLTYSFCLLLLLLLSLALYYSFHDAADALRVPVVLSRHALFVSYKNFTPQDTTSRRVFFYIEFKTKSLRNATPAVRCDWNAVAKPGITFASQIVFCSPRGGTRRSNIWGIHSSLAFFLFKSFSPLALRCIWVYIPRIGVSYPVGLSRSSLRNQARAGPSHQWLSGVIVPKSRCPLLIKIGF